MLHELTRLNPLTPPYRGPQLVWSFPMWKSRRWSVFAGHLLIAGTSAEVRQRAAELLGIHRPTLYAKLKRFGIAL